MVTLTKDNAIKAVRKNLDEQGWNPSEMFSESKDNSELDSIIEKTIPEAIDAVHRTAPQVDLESFESSFVEETEASGVLGFRTGKPVLRLISFRAADSDVVLSDVVAESSAFGRMQLNRFVRGTNDNPVLVAQSGTLDRFKYYTVGDRTVNRPHKLADYLYEYSPAVLDYDYARQYFRKMNPDVNVSMCSSVRSGNFYGRNLDWLYDNGVDMVVRTKATSTRHAVLGLAGGMKDLTRTMVESGCDSALYKVVPFYLQDGVNDAGVFCNINVVPVEGEATQVTEPAISEQDRICSLMLVRYVLDNFSSAADAVSYLRDYVAVYTPVALQQQGFESHWMIGDADSTYVIEFGSDGNMVVLEDQAVMTNFKLEDVDFVSGKVYTNADVEDGNLPSSIGITDHGSGLERYNLIVDNLPASTKQGMRGLMNSLLFTNCYKDETDPFWFSDYVGGDITTDTPSEAPAMTDRVARIKEEYESRSRDSGGTWHSTHSCVYDLANSKVYVVSQENMDEEFELAMNTEVAPTHIAQLSYIPYASLSDSYEVGSGILTSVIDQLTAMVLAIYGENEKAQYFFDKAKIQ